MACRRWRRRRRPPLSQRTEPQRRRRRRLPSKHGCRYVNDLFTNYGELYSIVAVNRYSLVHTNMYNIFVCAHEYAVGRCVSNSLQLQPPCIRAWPCSWTFVVPSCFLCLSAGAGGAGRRGGGAAGGEHRAALQHRGPGPCAGARTGACCLNFIDNARTPNTIRSSLSVLSGRMSGSQLDGVCGRECAS